MTRVTHFDISAEDPQRAIRGGGWFVMVEDCAGNIFGLMEEDLAAK